MTKKIRIFERFEIRKNSGSEHMTRLLDSQIRKKRIPPVLSIIICSSSYQITNYIDLKIFFTNWNKVNKFESSFVALDRGNMILYHGYTVYHIPYRWNIYPKNYMFWLYYKVYKWYRLNITQTKNRCLYRIKSSW